MGFRFFIFKDAVEFGVKYWIWDQGLGYILKLGFGIGLNFWAKLGVRIWVSTNWSLSRCLKLGFGTGFDEIWFWDQLLDLGLGGGFRIGVYNCNWGLELNFGLGFKIKFWVGYRI